MILHAMLVSIQAAIDISSHLISQNGLKRPATYRETFDLLAQAGMISEELAAELSDLAGFRNVLVHVYWDLQTRMRYSSTAKRSRMTLRIRVMLGLGS